MATPILSDAVRIPAPDAFRVPTAADIKDRYVWGLDLAFGPEKCVAARLNDKGEYEFMDLTANQGSQRLGIRQRGWESEATDTQTDEMEAMDTQNQGLNCGPDQGVGGKGPTVGPDPTLLGGGGSGKGPDEGADTEGLLVDEGD